MRKTHPHLTHLHQRLRQFRVERDWTQEQAAKRIGVGTETLKRFERGEITPTLVTALWIADVYGCSLDRILRGQD